MKAFFIITRTNEMHKHVESFTCLNSNESAHYIFEHRMGGGLPSSQVLDDEIRVAATNYKPDIIVYVGACSGRMPSAGIFRELKSIAPTVCFVSDAADQPWWPKVEEYDKEKSFSVIVALDGAPEWPQRDNHVTALTPLDPKYFPNPIKPHKDRAHVFGFAGNPGASHRGRMPIIGPLIKEGMAFRARSPSASDLKIDSGTYADAAKHMSETRIMPNFSWTGSFQRHHVKGRVVEAGWAGCCLLEMAQSPAKHYFEPGKDYIEYATVDDIRAHVKRLRDDPELSEEFGRNLRRKVETEHSPQAFWDRIFAKL